MIIVMILGGLGNQMFQYAFSKAYETRTGVHVKLDIENFATYDLRKYKLDLYGITPDYATADESKKCRNYIKKRTSYLPKSLRKFFKKEKYRITSNIIFEPKETIYDPQMFNTHEDAYYEGYFQNERYLEGLEDLLRKEFVLKTELNEPNAKMLEKIRNCNSVSLHVRRGDYTHMQQIFELCSLEYYQKSIDHIAANTDALHFFIFSNDIPWVRENLHIEHECTIVDINGENEDHFDLELMRNCKHNIIANSSFSWWGAWLNANPDKIIIAPQKWFSDERPCNVVPERWLKF